MAYPTYTVAAYQNGTATTSHSVTLPSGITSGKKLLMIARAAAAITTPTGWSVLIGSGNEVVFHRTADGSEGATQTVATSSSRFAAVTYCFDGWTNMEAAEATLSSDPPSLSPTFGSGDVLWIAALGGRRSDWTATVPTNYADTQTAANASNTATSRVKIVAGTRTLTASSENPGTFSVTGTIDTPIAYTVAILGTGGGSEVTGTAAASYTLTASATGTPTTPGTAGAAFALTATASGRRSTIGTAAASFTLTATSAGQPTTLGTATATFALTVTAAGNKVVYGATSTTYTLTAHATGTSAGVAVGTGAGVYTLTATSSGVRTSHATASATFTLTASATGTPATAGVALAAFLLAATAGGRRGILGSAGASFTLTAHARSGDLVVTLIRVFTVAVEDRTTIVDGEPRTSSIRSEPRVMEAS